MQMLAKVREEKKATIFSTINSHAERTKNFAGVIQFYHTVAFISRHLLPLFLSLWFLIYEKYVGGQENYVVTSGSSCQRSIAQRSRYYIHVSWVFVRRIYLYAYKNVEKKGSSEGTQNLEALQHAQVNAYIYKYLYRMWFSHFLLYRFCITFECINS